MNRRVKLQITNIGSQPITFPGLVNRRFQITERYSHSALLGYDSIIGSKYKTE